MNDDGSKARAKKVPAKKVPAKKAPAKKAPVVASDAALVLGQRMRDRRLQLDLSLERLATESGINWSYLGRAERGSSNLTLHNLLRIADALDIDPGELVAGLKPPHEDT